MTDGQEIKLKDLIQVTSTLSNIVSKSYGPRCRQSLLSTAIGQIMVTSDGFRLMKSLHIAHPVAMTIVKSCKQHHDNNGDGIKTFLLYLSTFFKGLLKYSLEDNQIGLKISRLIPVFMQEVLFFAFYKIFRKSLCLTVDSEIKDVQKCVSLVSQTVLLTHFSRKQANMFSDMIVEVIFNRSSSLPSVIDSISFYVNYFDHLILKCRQSYSKSETMPGILLRDFSRFGSDAGVQNVKFVILTNSIEGNVEDEEERSDVIKVSTETSLNACFTARVEIVKHFLEKLKSKDVKLILSNRKIPQYVAALCKDYGICVIGCLDDEDIKFLEVLSRRQALSSVYDDIPDSVIGEVDYKRVKLGGRFHVNLVFPELPAVQTLILCAPTEGLCYELSALVHKTLKTLDNSSNSTFYHNIKDFLHKDYVSSYSTSNKSCKTKKKEHQHSESLEIPSILNNSDKSNDRRHCLRNSEVNDLNLTVTLKCVNQDKTEMSAFENSKSLSQMSFIPSGGYFEFQISKILKESTRNFTDEKFGILSQIVSDCLLSIPQTLHQNIFPNHNSQQHEYLLALQTILDSTEDMCLSSRGGIRHCSTSDCQAMPEGSLELLSHKITILCNVLQLIQQLLKVDRIIGVKQKSK